MTIPRFLISHLLLQSVTTAQILTLTHLVNSGTLLLTMGWPFIGKQLKKLVEDEFQPQKIKRLSDLLLLLLVLCLSKDTLATVCILGNYALMYYLHLLVEALRFRRTFYSRWVPLAFGLSGSTCKAAGFFVDPISGGCAFIAVESSV